MLYEVALVEKKKVDGELQERLVLGPRAVMAKDDKTAGAIAVMQGKDFLGDADLSNVEVLVRPFV